MFTVETFSKNMSIRRENRKVILSTVVGNAMEWYDYLLYAHFASVIGRLFFPLKNANHSLLLALATFTAGFIARPFGGYIFGLIGDKVGRKAALNVSILLIMLPTFGMGILPAFAQIGIAAPILMAFLRVLQGISLGGEYSSSTTFLVESAPPQKKAFFGSFSSLSLALGVLISSLTVLLIEVLFTEEQIINFAWRIPFLISVIYGFCGIMLRRSINESPEFLQTRQEGNFLENPFKELFINYKKNLLFASSAFMLSIPFYGMVVFSKGIMVSQGVSSFLATLLNTFLIIIYMMTTAFSGYLSDKSSERIMLLVGGIGLFIFAYPFFLLIKTGNVIIMTLASMITGFLIGMYQGAAPSFCVKCFDIKVRASGIALGYNIPAIIFGGTAPMVITAIMQYTGGNLLFVAFYVMFGCFVGSLCSILSIKYIDLKKM